MPEREFQNTTHLRRELGQMVVSRLLAYADHPPYEERQKKALSSAFQNFADQQFIPHQNSKPTIRNTPG